MAKKKVRRKKPGDKKPTHRILKVTFEGRTAAIRILPKAEFWKRTRRRGARGHQLKSLKEVNKWVLEATNQAFGLALEVRETILAGFARIEAEMGRAEKKAVIAEFNKVLKASLTPEQFNFNRYFFNQMFRIYFGMPPR